MNAPDVIAALREKQMAVLADIRTTEAKLAKLREDQATILAAIRLFDPHAPVKPPAMDALGLPHGQMSRSILDVLRRSEAALAARDIALALLERQGVAEPSHEAVEATVARVRTALARMKDKLHGETRGQTVYWRVG